MASDGCLAKSSSAERLRLGRGDLRFESLHVDVAIAGESDRKRLDRAVGVFQVHDHVLQRVGCGPVAIGMTQRRVAVHEVDQGRDRGRIGCVVHHCCRQAIERDRRGSGVITASTLAA